MAGSPTYLHDRVLGFCHDDAADTSYRDSLQRAARFLREHHPDRVLLINLSPTVLLQPALYNLFKNTCVEFPCAWHAPAGAAVLPLETSIHVTACIHKWCAPALSPTLTLTLTLTLSLSLVTAGCSWTRTMSSARTLTLTPLSLSLSRHCRLQLDADHVVCLHARAPAAAAAASMLRFITACYLTYCGEYLTVAEAARDLPCVPAVSQRHADTRLSLLSMAVPAPLRPAAAATAAQVAYGRYFTEALHSAGQPAAHTSLSLVLHRMALESVPWPPATSDHDEAWCSPYALLFNAGVHPLQWFVCCESRLGFGTG